MIGSVSCGDRLHNACPMRAHERGNASSCLLALAMLLGAVRCRRWSAESAARSHRAQPRQPGHRHRRGRRRHAVPRRRCGCAWRPAGTPTGATRATPACRRTWHSPLPPGVHSRPDRLARAAAGRRRPADDLRLHRRPAAAGRRSRGATGATDRATACRLAGLRRRSACRRKATFDLDLPAGHAAPSPRRRCSPPPTRHAPRPSPGRRDRAGRHAVSARPDPAIASDAWFLPDSYGQIDHGAAQPCRPPPTACTWRSRPARRSGRTQPLCGVLLVRDAGGQRQRLRRLGRPGPAPSRARRCWQLLGGSRCSAA